jgi:hypothetical protein
MTQPDFSLILALIAIVHLRIYRNFLFETWLSLATIFLQDLQWGNSSYFAALVCLSADEGSGSNESLLTHSMARTTTLETY